MQGERRIVVTGLGCVSPVGNDTSLGLGQHSSTAAAASVR